MALSESAGWRSRIDAQAPMDGAPAFPGQGRLSAIQQPARLKLADRIEALATLNLSQLDTGFGATPARILWPIVA
jgi:hypothetical protein